MRIYADNAATTKISRKARDAMISVMDEVYGNPSSLHSEGQRAAEVLLKAREDIADCLGCSADEIYFTSGGSESDNTAIVSAVKYAEKRGKRHIVTTAFEHHAVLHAIKKLEAQGYEATYLDVHENGIVRPDEVEKAIREDTALVSVMYANNEIGTIQPISEIGRICNEKKILFHTDAVQAAGHVKLDVGELGVDYLALSAHKFHGPRGIGVLYAKRRATLSPLIEGGAQEKNRRAGTENLPAIAGMAAALKDAVSGIDETACRVSAMRDKLIDGLLKIPHTVLNGDKESRLPGNVNVCFEGIEGESLLLMLDMMGVAASSGSACTSGSLDPSHVLLAIGRPHEIAHGSLRLTIDDENTDEEIEKMTDIIPKVVEKLRDMSPVWDDLQKGRNKYVIQ